MNTALTKYRELQGNLQPVFLSLVTSGLAPGSTVFALVVTTLDATPSVFCVAPDENAVGGGPFPHETIAYHGLTTAQWRQYAMPKLTACNAAHELLQDKQVFCAGLTSFVWPILGNFYPQLLTDANYAPRAAIDLTLCYRLEELFQSCPEERATFFDQLERYPDIEVSQEYWDARLKDQPGPRGLAAITELAGLEETLPLQTDAIMLLQAKRLRALFLAML